MTKIDFLIIVIIVIISFFCFFLFVPPVSETHQLREQLHREELRQAELEQKVTEYERQIDKIKRNDPAEIERIARDRLGFSREGEEIYQLEIPEKPPQEQNPNEDLALP